MPDFKTLYREDPDLMLALDRRHHAQHSRSLARFLLAFDPNVHPGSAHRFLSRLEDTGRLLRCYTMNLDGLEGRVLDKARVRYVHGRIDDAARCGRRKVPYATLIDVAKRHDGFAEYRAEHGCNLRPGFVLYGDPTRHTSEMLTDLQHADLVLVFGTRLNVEPVASLVRECASKAIAINAEPIDGVPTLVGTCEDVCARLERRLR